MNQPINTTMPPSFPPVYLPKVRVVLFDCFGTLFDMSSVPREEIRAYVDHVNKADFTPYEFPDSWYDLKAHPDVAEGMHLLSKYVLVGAFSNGSPGLIKSLAMTNAFFFDWVYNPTAHTAYKPSAKAYETVCRLWTGSERLTARAMYPDQILMITANPTFGDLEGASGVGMQVATIRNPDSRADHFEDVLALANARRQGEA